MSFKEIKNRRARKAQEGALIGKLSPYQIIWKPIITEKAYKMVEDKNIYTFRIHRDANKNDVKQSLKAIYDVVPVSIRTVVVPSKWRMYRKTVRKGYKKAYVSLAKWDSIELAG